MHVVVAEGLTNSPGSDFMSEIGLARAGSNIKQVHKIIKVMLDALLFLLKMLFSQI